MTDPITCMFISPFCARARVERAKGTPRSAPRAVRLVVPFMVFLHAGRPRSRGVYQVVRVIIFPNLYGDCDDPNMDVRLCFLSGCGKGIYRLPKPKDDLENFEIPVWQYLGVRWYEKVNRL